MKNTITQSDQSGAIVVADEQRSETVRMDFDLEELISLATALSRVLSIPEITNPLYVMISLESNYGLRARFAMADLELGFVVIHSHGDGSIMIEADTVLQDLEHHGQCQFEVDNFGYAAAWIRSLGLTLANLDQSWGSTQVVDAAEARLRRLE